MTRSTCEDFEDLLAEIREECPRAALSATIEFAEIPLDELATWLTKRERAAAERMRERCLDAVAMQRNASVAIRELEPEEQ